MAVPPMRRAAGESTESLHIEMGRPDDLAARRERRERLRIVAADDHPVFRAGVRRVLDGRPEFELVACVETAGDALEAIRTHEPDVAVVDLRLPDLDGVEVVEHIEREGLRTRVVIVSAYEDSAAVYRAIASGARAYISKASSADTLRAAIEAVARGETVIPASMQSGLAHEIRARREIGDTPVLTPRELEILSLTAEGLTAPAIADHLILGVTTVKTHLHNIYAKLEVSDRAAAVAYAIRRGILS
jgi:two-component system nitrate/nitrite response regulator NarL